VRGGAGGDELEKRKRQPDEPVVVRLARSGGSQCWQGDDSASAIGNSSDAFRDKND
jgi:hypothetical protein